MFKYKNVRTLLMEERKKNEALKAKQAKLEANQEYIAMMSDIDLDDDMKETEEQSNEQV